MQELLAECLMDYGLDGYWYMKIMLNLLKITLFTFQDDIGCNEPGALYCNTTNYPVHGCLSRTVRPCVCV